MSRQNPLPLKSGKYLLLLFILANGIFPVCSQDLTGLWTGGMTSDTTGVPVLNTRYVLNIKEQENNVVRGKAYVIERRFQFEGILDFIGIVNNDLLTIHELKIRSSKTPVDNQKLCIKLLHLKVAKDKNSLDGPWKGMFELDNTCIPGKAYLERYSALNTSSIPDRVLQLILLDSGPSKFNNTSLDKPILINVASRLLTITLNDFQREDNDTVSVYLNRESIIQKLRIENKPYTRRIRLDRSIAVNELILVANNLGQIPPNTSVMTIDDGITRQRIVIETTKQRSASIYIRFNPAMSD